MRYAMGIAVLIVGLLSGLAGCTIVDGATVMVGEQRAAIDPSQVKIYRTPPAKYVEIAMLTAKAGHDFKGDQSLMNSAIQRLKEDAAKVGANGLLLQDVNSRTTGFAAIGGGDQYNDVSAVAIFVP